jgi:hypothetical protein
VLRDLREHRVDVVKIGQYLQPSAKHAKIDRWVHPDEFRWFREQGEALGFGSVFFGPLVRSSYRADEQQHAVGEGSWRGDVLAPRPWPSYWSRPRAATPSRLATRLRPGPCRATPSSRRWARSR